MSGTDDITVTDAKGRKLVIHEMDPADQLDLFEACGVNNANMSWVGMALLVCSVRSIDDVPIPVSTTPQHVKNAARLLGKDGVAAVARVLNADVGGSLDETVAIAKN